MNIGFGSSLPHQTCLHFHAGSKGLSLCSTVVRRTLQRASMLNFEAFRALWPGFGRALTNLECFRGRDLRFFGVCDQKYPTELTDSVRD